MVKKSSEVTARNVTATSSEATHIAGNTQILFTLKSFFALIGSMLALFFTFYMLVVTPRIDKTEKHYDDMYKEQKTLNESFTKEITEIKFNMKGVLPSSTILPQQQSVSKQ